MSTFEDWALLKSTNQRYGPAFTRVESLAVECFIGDCRENTIRLLRSALVTLPETKETGVIQKMNNRDLRLWATAIASGVTPSTRP